MKLVKTIARVMGALLGLPYLMEYALWRLTLGPQRAHFHVSERIAKRTGVLGVYIRQACYRRLLDHVGSDVHFGFLSIISKPQTVIGERVYIGRFCAIGYVQLDDEVMVADGVQILSGRHQHGEESVDGRSLRANPHRFEKVIIGRGAWLCAGAIVMADIGERAVVGAGAVVVKPVPAGGKVGGVPAKPLK